MNESILIVEDEATIRITVGGFPARLGYRVAQAEGAASGVAHAARADLTWCCLICGCRTPTDWRCWPNCASKGARHSWSS